MRRRLRRDANRGVIGGVAAGFAEYFDLDPILPRIGFVVLTLASGFGILLYLVCWVIMPRDATRSPAHSSSSDDATTTPVGDGMADAAGPGRGRVIVGSILIVMGTLLLLDRFPPFGRPGWLGSIPWTNLWPVVLVALGIAMMLEAVRGSNQTSVTGSRTMT